MKDTVFAFLVAVAAIGALIAISLGASRNDAQATKECAARGGKYIRGHGIELCVDPRMLR